MLDIVASYHCMKFQEKVMNQTCENDKKPSFGPKFGLQKFYSWILTLLDVIHSYKLSLCAISRKTNEPSLRKLQKT